jgi:predicted porin
VTLSGTFQAGYQQHISAATENFNVAGVTGGSTSKLGAAGLPTLTTPVKGQVKGFTLMDRTFKFTAVEDLGGGMAAFGDATMESAGDFRTSFVQFADVNIGLRSTSWGEVKFSNTRAGDTYSAIASPAISLRDGLYDDSGINGTRADIDLLTYTTPELVPGLKASIAHADLGNGDINAPASNQSNQTFGLAYVNGPVTVMGAYKTKLAKAVASSTQISKDTIELALSYNAGFAVIGLGYDAASTKGTTAIAKDGTKVQTDKDSFGASLTVPMGALSFGAEYWSRGASTESRFGAMYALSKRTSLTAAYGLKDFPKLAFPAAITSDNQYRFSVRHTF